MVKYSQKMGLLTLNIGNFDIIVKSTLGISEIRIELGNRNSYYQSDKNLSILLEVVRAEKANLFFEDIFREMRKRIQDFFDYC